MTILDFLPCFAAVATVALLPMTLVLLLRYFGRSKQDRLAIWRSVGLSPETGTWQATWAWEALAGEYRGRKITISWGSLFDYLLGFLSERDERRTRVKVAVRCPQETRLVIKPKGNVDLSAWLGRRDSPQGLGVDDQFFSIQSYPLDLALRALDIPRISAILLSDPMPAIELKGNQLQFKRPGYFPDPQDGVALFDTLCDLAELIEQGPNSAGAG